MAEREYKTNNRTRILDFLKDNQNRSVSVKDINNHLRDCNSEVNITTIYRYLDKLECDGKLIKYTSQKGESTYQYSLPGNTCSDHLHLKCTQCGCVIHLDCHFMDEIAEHISKEHGFSVQCKSSVIYGLCHKCR